MLRLPYLITLGLTLGTLFGLACEHIVLWADVGAFLGALYAQAERGHPAVTPLFRRPVQWRAGIVIPRWGSFMIGVAHGRIGHAVV